MKKSKIEERIALLTEDEKNVLIEKDKKQDKTEYKIFLVSTILIILLLIVLLFATKEYLVFSIVIVFPVCLLLLLIFGFPKYCKGKKDEKRLFNQVRQLLSKGTESNKQQSSIINFNDIATVILMDSFTEVSDKLHPVLNYQEIIQTRIYVFKISYKNGTNAIVKMNENDSNCEKLLLLADIKK